MSVGTTYIVIEIPEKENGLDIVNYLMTQTKARFTITKNICEYAEEKGKLAGSSSVLEPKDETPNPESRASVAPPAPVAIREESPEIEEIEPEMVHVPKQERFDHPPEPYRHTQPVAQYQQAQYQLENYGQMFEQYQQKLNMTVPMHQHSGQHDYEDWQAAVMSSPGGVISGEPEKKRRKTNELTTPPERNEDRAKRRGTIGKHNASYDQKCGVCDGTVKVVAFGMNARSNHAITHLEMKRFACPVKGCKYLSKHRSNAYAHLKNAHPSQKKMTITECLTPEQKAQLNEMVCRCFPEMRERIQEMQRGAHVNYEVDEDGVEEVCEE